MEQDKLEQQVEQARLLPERLRELARQGWRPVMMVHDTIYVERVGGA